MAEAKPDLQIDYDRLHKLAKDARVLKENLDRDVPGLSTGVPSSSTSNEIFNEYMVNGLDNGSFDYLGSTDLMTALSQFNQAWEQPFKDSMERLGELAQLLDGIATAFYDVDSDFAARASTGLAQMSRDAWKAQQRDYAFYERTKDLMFQPSPKWNKDGVLTDQPAVPLMTWDTIPEKPGDSPTPISTRDIWNQLHPDQPMTGTDTVTTSQLDDEGDPVSETTKVESTEGLTYEETTTYDYKKQGDTKYINSTTTTLTHSDGSTEKITTTYTYDETKTKVLSSQSDSSYDSATGEDSTTTVKTTVKPGDETVDEKSWDSTKDNTGYTSEVKEGDETTTIDVTNKPGVTEDVKVTTDDKGVVRTYVGNADSDTWTQTEGPAEQEETKTAEEEQEDRQREELKEEGDRRRNNPGSSKI